MGAGTPENGSGRAVVTRDLRSLDTSMNANALVALERDDTAEESSIVRAIDLDETTCVEVHGGDVVFAALVERTDDGNALARTGEDIPVMTTSIYSEHELRIALQTAGYESDHIENALSLRLGGERGRQVAHLAESRTRDHPAQIESRDSDASEEEADVAIATDGGTPTQIDAADYRRQVERETESHDEACDECGASTDTLGSWQLVDVSDSDWNDYDTLCDDCLIDVGGPGEAPDDHDDGGGRGSTDVSPCPGCGDLTPDDTCGKERCEGADEIDEAPL